MVVDMRAPAAAASGASRQRAPTNEGCTLSLSLSLGGESSSSKTKHEMPPKKQHALASRVKRIMQADEDVGKIAQATPILIGEKRERRAREREKRIVARRGRRRRPSFRPRKRARAPSLPAPPAHQTTLDRKTNDNKPRQRAPWSCFCSSCAKTRRASRASAAPRRWQRGTCEFSVAVCFAGGGRNRREREWTRNRIRARGAPDGLLRRATRK